MIIIKSSNQQLKKVLREGIAKQVERFKNYLWEDFKIGSKRNRKIKINLKRIIILKRA
jgi:hypothetical protein